MKKIILLLSAIIVVSSVCSQVNIYPAPAGVLPSTEYKVWVNDKEAFVYPSPIPAAYCSFDMGGPVTLTIRVSRDVKWVDVRPLSSGVQPSFKDSTITLKLNKPQALSVEINGSIKHPLFVFANPPESDRPSPTDKNVFYFKAGKVHHAGLIELASNQSVYIEGGAVVIGAIVASNARNIKISGRGILDGTWNNRFNDEQIKRGAFGELPAASNSTYRRLMEFNECENVTVNGVTLHNNTTWQIVPVSCKNVTIDGIRIVSDQPSDDGIDIVHSKNVTVKNSFFRTKDDCIAIKAYIDKKEAQAVDSIEVTNCVFWNALWGNALEIGFELNGVDVKNISFKDCDIIRVEAGAAISIHNAGISTVSNILFENIRVEDARQKLFDIAIFRSQYSLDGTTDPAEKKRLYLNGAWDGVLHVPRDRRSYHAQFRGHVQNIVFRNIRIVDGGFPYSLFYGFDETHQVKNVLIDNLTVYGRRINSVKAAKLYMENVQGWQIK